MAVLVHELSQRGVDAGSLRDHGCIVLRRAPALSEPPASLRAQGEPGQPAEVPPVPGHDGVAVPESEGDDPQVVVDDRRARGPKTARDAGRALLTNGYSLVLADDAERGRPLLEKAIARNPCHPGWFNHALCIDEYMKGEYESALQETLKPAFEVGFWGALLRAAVLGQLGRFAEAGATVARIVALVPDFERRARDLTHRPILSDTIVDALLDGLCKAGLRIGDE